MRFVAKRAFEVGVERDGFLGGMSRDDAGKVKAVVYTVESLACTSFERDGVDSQHPGNTTARFTLSNSSTEQVKLSKHSEQMISSDMVGVGRRETSSELCV